MLLIKIRQISFRVHVRMAIPYQTAKFKSNNSVKNVVWAQTAKFNDRQYFQLYGTYVYSALLHVQCLENQEGHACTMYVQLAIVYMYICNKYTCTCYIH